MKACLFQASNSRKLQVRALIWILNYTKLSQKELLLSSIHFGSLEQPGHMNVDTIAIPEFQDGQLIKAWVDDVGMVWNID